MRTGIPIILGVFFWVASPATPAQVTNRVPNTTMPKLETEKRLDAIILPSVTLEKVSFFKAVEYLRLQIAGNSQDGKGVEIAIELNPPIPEPIIPTNLNQKVRTEAIKLNERYQQALIVGKELLTNKVITLNLRDIPAYDVLLLVGQLSQLRTCIRSNKFIFGHGCLQREVRVESLYENIFDISHTNTTHSAQPEDVTSFFRDVGVDLWGPWLPDEGIVIMIGTEEDFELFERCR